MSNKKINPDNLSRVNGAFKDMSGELEHNVSDLISSSATEKLQAATDGIKKLSKEMVETISSLDEYLRAVGEAFRSADASMAQWLISQRINTKIFHNYMNSPEHNSGEFFYYKFSMI